jgi:hypothetical protein
MHVPHATNFYGKFENLNFDIFCKKRLFQIKTALTLRMNSKKMYNISKTIYTKFYIGFLHNFLFLKIPKGNMKVGRF